MMSFSYDSAVPIVLDDIGIESVSHGPVEEIITNLAMVHQGNGPSIFRRFHFVKNESLMLETMWWMVVYRLHVEQNHITLNKLF